MAGHGKHTFLAKVAPETEAGILREYAAGTTIRAIGEMFGVSASFCSVLARRHGLNPRNNSKTHKRKYESAHRPTKMAVPKTRAPKPDLAQDIAVKDLATRGFRINAIAAMLRCPYRTVEKILAGVVA